jgi:hypothetical protein
MPMAMGKGLLRDTIKGKVLQDLIDKMRGMEGEDDKREDAIHEVVNGEEDKKTIPNGQFKLSTPRDVIERSLEKERQERPDEWMYKSPRPKGRGEEDRDPIVSMPMSGYPLSIPVKKIKEMITGGDDGDDDLAEEKKAFLARPISSPARGNTRSVMMDIQIGQKKKKK